VAVIAASWVSLQLLFVIVTNQPGPFSSSTGLRAHLSSAADASSDLRRELCEVVNAELLLDLRDLIDHLFKAIVSKEFVFFLFEIFS
jgi:hypothetical protein